MKKVLWILLLIVTLAAALHDRFIGMFLERSLEQKLSRLFDMPVTIQGLRVRLWGEVLASRIVFMNSQEFAEWPHLDARNVRGEIDLRALSEKRVEIDTLFLDRPFYFIDRIPTSAGPTNNVITWWRHIKKVRAESSKNKPPSPEGPGWHVRISDIRIANGTFIFHDRSSKEGEKKFVFQELDGFLDGFEWPSPDPSHLSQKTGMKGTFGERYPAPFEIHGRANFATSQVSFNLEGEIKEGELIEHERLWEGSSIRIHGGKFQLKSRTICLRRELQSYNDLILKSVEVTPGDSAADKIFGMPQAAAMAFLKQQEIIHLKVPVHGKLSDPQFGFHHAFRAAFQKALADRMKNGIAVLTQGTAAFATQTRTIVQKTPGRLVNGLGKITNSMVGAVPAVKDEEQNHEKS